MGRLLIVSKADRLEKYQEIAQRYGTGFELNDFFAPALLDDKGALRDVIQKYRQMGLPEGSTMHGVFFDMVIFSQDAGIREATARRMEQSMQIAEELGVKGVVFHTNTNPILQSPQYDENAVDRTSAYLAELLDKFPRTEIYLENMFDNTPNILERISQRLKEYPNYGICLDYAHAYVFGRAVSVDVWVKALEPFVKHIHINDNNLAGDLHWAVGTGMIHWWQFVEYYHTYFKDCSVLVEVTEPEDQKRSLAYLMQYKEFVTDTDMQV